MENNVQIGLFFGGKSFEHEVSLRSIKSVYQAIDKEKFNVILFPVAKDGTIYFAPDMDIFHQIDTVDELKHLLEKIYPHQIKEKGVDVVFSTLHGAHGENGAFQGFFEVLDIPYVGPQVKGSAIGMDKELTKKLLDKAGISVTPYYTVKNMQDLNLLENKLTYPCFVKASSLGSSVGVYKCQNVQEVKSCIVEVLKLDRKVLIEQAISGREIEVAVLGGPGYIASIPGEIIPHHEFYSYEAKYIDENGATLEIPATGIDSIKFQQLAIKVCEELEIEGMARVDFFITGDGHYFVNEVNTLPGFTSISMYPKLFEKTGISYRDLIEKLIEHALNRDEKIKSLNTTLSDIFQKT